MRWQVLSVVGALYAVQFVPAIFVFMTLPIIMREAGHSATVIGLVQLVGIPYIFKFVWAPLIDRFKPGRYRYKSWIVVLSTIHVAALSVLAFMDPSGPVVPLFVVLFVAVAAVSTQDVAVDALSISLMRSSERAIGATFQSFGIYFGAVVGAFGFLHLYDEIGWTAVLFAQAALFALPLLLLVLVEEPRRPRDAPPISYRTVLHFFAQPGIRRWLALLATVRLPLVFVSLPIRLMMVDEGMTKDEIALWFGLIAMSAAGGAALLIGPLMRKLPRVRALFVVGLVNLAVLVVVYFVAAHLPEAVRYAIVITWAAVAITDTVLLRGAMDKARLQSPGFDFSVQVALFTLLAMLTSPISGALIDSQGYVPAFVISLVLALVPLTILGLWFRSPDETSAAEHDGKAVVSIGTLRTRRAHAILDSCEAHFAEHGITCRRIKPDCLLMEAMGCKVEMLGHATAVDIRIETPTDNFMIFIRDEIVEHVGEIDLRAAQSMRWSGGIGVGELPSNFRILRAVRRQEIFPGFIRVTLAGVDVEALTSGGIHIKVMMPAERGRKPVWPVISENGGIAWPEGDDKLHARFVTIRHIRLQEREIDIDVAHHAGGLISDWAALEGDDQEVGVMGPGGDTDLPKTENVILAADLTGLPALARLIEASQGRVTGCLFAAAPSQQVLEDYLPPSGLQVRALNPATFADDVVDGISHCTTDSVPYAWFAGEFATARTLRTVLQERFGLHKKQQHSMAYWRQGEPGHMP
ncbi:MFS transporter [Thiosocius teredinicola]|uniref:MFS transporter n=1 Tax=Thiosocius teredinicola TaxID=1973002 RepID=UPI000990CF41